MSEVFRIGNRLSRDGAFFGTVLHVDDNGVVFIESKFGSVDDSDYWVGRYKALGIFGKSIYTSNTYLADKYTVEAPQPTFRLGDRITSAYRPAGAKEDDQATVIQVEWDGNDILIQFDRAFEEGHSGGNVGVEGRCWYVGPKDLTLVPTKVTKPTKTFSPNSQCGKLLMTLASGRSITPLEAFGTLGIYRLAARIHELRNAGHKIKAEVRYDEQGKSYARYTLKSRKFV